MRKNAWGVAIAALVAIGLLLALRNIWHPRNESPVEVKRERNADSARAADALHAKAVLEGQVAVLQQQLRDTAAVYRARERRHSATADALRDTLDAVEAAAAGDSTKLAMSCQVRYSLRTAEASALRAALADCGQRATAESTRASVVFDSLSQSASRLAQALQASDSARRVEIVRPRPCKRNLLVAKPGCGTVDALTFGLGVLTGIVVTR